ncbi:hypothetical protein AVEN_143379-1 [Araneus ventricosus]|uniref:Uncharacterized protein n=1 Tax=Araneus ventricosus TaxID=182803 RepID=A0A4Y2ADZ5_ARAVE|nr:hypothetical protein AVEN_143379-1 [Araneus ventricosus]
MIVDIVTKIVRSVYGESWYGTSWIIENVALFKEYSRKLRAQVARKEQYLLKLTTEADSKSLIITVIAPKNSAQSNSCSTCNANKTPKRFKDIPTQSLVSATPGIYSLPDRV